MSAACCSLPAAMVPESSKKKKKSVGVSFSVSDEIPEKKIVLSAPKSIPEEQSVNSGHLTKNAKRGILYNREIYMSTLTMLKKRGGYLVDGILETAISLEDPMMFAMAISSPMFENLLRNILAGMFSKKAVPSSRMLMSLLVPNPEGRKTAIFFVEGKTSQVPKKLMSMLFKALVDLDNADARVSEIIIVAPAPLSLDTYYALNGIKAEYNYQVFRDDSILSPPDETVFSPKIELLSKTEVDEIFSNDKFAPSPDNLQRVSHSEDALIKYFGIKQSSIIKITRRSVIPGSIRDVEITYALVV